MTSFRELIRWTERPGNAAVTARMWMTGGLLAVLVTVLIPADVRGQAAAAGDAEPVQAFEVSAGRFSYAPDTI